MKNIWREFPTWEKIKRLESDVGPFEAIIFDMDGTLVNTEIVHALALEEGLQRLGFPAISASLLERRYSGMPDPKVYEDLIDRGDLPSFFDLDSYLILKEEMFPLCLQQLDKARICSPDLGVFLQKRKNYPGKMALVTASEANVVKMVLRHMQLENFFDLTLTREDCLHQKPHPWPYLEAMRRLGIDDVERALIFEDSPTGLSAAIKSGAQVIQAKWF